MEGQPNSTYPNTTYNGAAPPPQYYPPPQTGTYTPNTTVYHGGAGGASASSSAYPGAQPQPQQQQQQPAGYPGAYPGSYPGPAAPVYGNVAYPGSPVSPASPYSPYPSPQPQVVYVAAPVRYRYGTTYGERARMVYWGNFWVKALTFLFIAMSIAGIVLTATADTSCRSSCREQTCRGDDDEDYPCTCDGSTTCERTVFGPQGQAGVALLVVGLVGLAIQSCVACGCCGNGCFDSCNRDPQFANAGHPVAPPPIFVAQQQQQPYYPQPAPVPAPGAPGSTPQQNQQQYAGQPMKMGQTYS